ncbi:MAG: tyrosine--tRNA ligase [Candidatus Omnitrophota bacterium]
MIIEASEQLKMLTRGVAEIIGLEELKARLEHHRRSRKPLRIKAGFDPTAADIHLGHVVLLNKLRQFQDLGHVVYFLIGDFTAQIGDPTGQKKMRPPLSQQQIKKNALTYTAQVFKILDRKRTRVVFNSCWFNRMSAQKILELSAFSTVAQILARADFRERFEQQNEISILEFIYPLLQAYDSVYLKADVELGGTDQKFNLLMGRQLQESFKQPPQVVMMTPLLEGTDGVQKMSKSLKNYIGIAESPREIFGKVMSIPDALMLKYYEVLTDEDLEKLKATHPRDAKLRLAYLLVERLYNSRLAQREKEGFIKVFSKKEVPADIPVYAGCGDERLSEILLRHKLVSSGNEFRRLLKEGAITLNGERLIGDDSQLMPGILKVGKRRFLRIVATKDPQ